MGVNITASKRQLLERLREWGKCHNLFVRYDADMDVPYTELYFYDDLTGSAHNIGIRWEFVENPEHTFQDVTYQVNSHYKKKREQMIADGLLNIESLYPRTLFATVQGENEWLKKAINKRYDKPTIKNVIFNDPATIVFWSDDTKTIVKCQDGDEFDPEKGLAMAISKKFFGNDRSYFDVFKKWVGRYEKQEAKKRAARIMALSEMIKRNSKQPDDKTKADE